MKLSVYVLVFMRTCFLAVIICACTSPNISAGQSHAYVEQTPSKKGVPGEETANADPDGHSESGPRAVATFESIGLYWKTQSGSKDNECQVRYRKFGTTEWRDGFPLWYDERNNEYRGSVVHLEAGTHYEVELTLQRTKDKRTIAVKTWDQEFPVSKQVELPETSRETLVLEESGTSDGYVLYTHEPGRRAVNDVEGREFYNIKIEASHVIVRGLTLKNAMRTAVHVSKDSHDVIIEENDISGWGRVLPDGWGKGPDSAIYAKGEAVERLVIQRNKIHNPRSDSNAWDEFRDRTQSYHPSGPQGITIWDSGGNHVIRFNEIYSDPDHKFNDCIGGGRNYSKIGFPNKDSDIYGNVISHCWDDAIEAEGANANVRIWGNYIDLSYVMIAVAPTHVGPIYIWRNVADRSRKSGTRSMEDAKRGAFIKTQSKVVRGKYFGDGRIYVFHNTLIQRDGMNQGVSAGPARLGSLMSNLVTRNNIFHVNADYRPSIVGSEEVTSNDFDYDLFNGKILGGSGHQQHGIKAVPRYNPDNRAGEYRLDPSSPGYGAGVFIPNFSDGFTGAGPDMGAYEANVPPLQFGVHAHR
jgi:hypothetical protein